jgi:hypothetical protein
VTSTTHVDIDFDVDDVEGEVSSILWGSRREHQGFNVGKRVYPTFDQPLLARIDAMRLNYGGYLEELEIESP